MIENAKRDAVSLTERQVGSHSAGQIRTAGPGKHLRVLADPVPEAGRRARVCGG